MNIPVQKNHSSLGCIGLLVLGAAAGELKALWRESTPEPQTLPGV